MARIFCVGRNYAAHAAELGNALPTEPVIFMKPIIGFIAPIEYSESIYYGPALLSATLLNCSSIILVYRASILSAERVSPAIMIFSPLYSGGLCEPVTITPELAPLV